MNDIKKFLKRMIDNKGFIARGIYSEDIYLWTSSSYHSQSVINMNMFHQMKRKGYIRKDVTGRYYPTDEARKFAAPWYKRIFHVI